MKVADLKFPVKISLIGTSTTYLVKEGSVGLDWTVLNKDGTDGVTYTNSTGRDRLAAAITDGSAIVVEDKAPLGSIAIDIDSSKVAEALRLATELEATLIRIKALLA